MDRWSLFVVAAAIGLGGCLTHLDEIDAHTPVAAERLTASAEPQVTLARALVAYDWLRAGDARGHRSLQGGGAGLCALDVDGVRARVEVVGDAVVVTAEVGDSASVRTLQERAQAMTLAFRDMRPSSLSKRPATVPFGAGVRAERLARGVAVIVEPTELARLQELGELLHAEARYLGHGWCVDRFAEVRR